MCDSLGIEPKPNNGTLRLPLKPIGLHSDQSTSSEEDHPDLIDSSPAEATEPKLIDPPNVVSVPVDGASSTDTTPAPPAKTDILIVTASPEGTSIGNNLIL